MLGVYSSGKPRILSAAFSAIIIVGAFKFPLTTLGMIEASTTRRLSTPKTCLKYHLEYKFLDLDKD